MIPGTFGNFGSSGGGGPLTLTYNTSSKERDDGSTLHMPSGINSGDLIVVMQAASEQVWSVSTAAGTGFTSLDSKAGNLNVGGKVGRIYYGIQVSYKIADGTEGGTIIGGFQNQDEENAAIFVYTPSTAITSVTITGLQYRKTAGNPAPQVISTSSSSVATIGFSFFGGGYSGNPNGTFSPTPDAHWDIGNQSLFEWEMAMLAQDPTATDIDVDLPDEGSISVIRSGYIEVS